MTFARLGKWLGVSGAAVIALSLILAAGLYLLLVTTSGSHWLLSVLAKRLPAEVSWQNFEGDLNSGIHLHNLSYEDKNTRIAVFEISGKWDALSLLGGQLVVEQLKIESPNIEIMAGATPTAVMPWPYLGSAFPVQMKHLDIGNSLMTHGQKTHRIERIEFSGSLGLFGLRIRQLVLVQEQDRTVRIQGRVGARPPYALKLNVNWKVSNEEAPSFSGEGDIKGSLAQFDIEHKITNPVDLNSSGTITTGFDPDRAILPTEQIEARLSHQWQFENLYIAALKQPLSSRGSLQSVGSVHDYRLEGALDLVIHSMNSRQPLPLKVQLNAAGNADSMQLDQLLMHSDSMRLSSSGRLGWRDTPSWDLLVKGNDLNPELFWPEWPGKVGGEWQTQGVMTEQGVSWQVKLEQLNGTLRNYPLSVSGKLGYSGGQYLADKLRLYLGDNALTLNLQQEQPLRANWKLEAPDLSQAIPGLKGQLQAEGTANDRQIKATMKGAELRYNDFYINNLDAQLSNSTTRDHQYKLLVQASDLQLSGHPVAAMKVSLEGTPQQHSYRLSADQERQNIDFQGKGSWRAPRWQTDITAANLTGSHIGSWALDAPIQASVNRSGYTLNSGCWTQRSASFCVTSDLNEQTGLNLSAQLAMLPLSSLTPWLPQNVAIQGAVSGEIALANLLKEVSGTVSLSATEGYFNMASAKSPQSRFDFHNVQLRGSLSGNQLDLDGKGVLLNTGRAELNLTYPLRQPDAPLKGEFNAKFAEITWLDPFLMFVDELKGNADLSLRVDGTTAQPRLSGKVELGDLSAFVPQLGIQLRNGKLKLQQNGQTSWSILGQLESGEGMLRLGGDAEVNNLRDWKAKLAINGENIQTVELEQIKAHISPQLQMDVNPQQLLVTGEIAIPRASINLEERPANTISPSRDEVIIEQQDGGKTEVSGLATSTDVNLVLGNTVHFNGFGVDGDISGHLRIREKPERPLRIDGVLTIDQGSYKAYGQKLSIVPGRLIFQGPPDSPLVDIRASRQVGEKLVGIQIGGTPQYLASELFSEPVLAPTEIMALLLTGKPLMSTTPGEADLLMSAAGSLGIRQSAMLTQHIRQSLGLDVFALSSDSGLEQSALTIGKFLTPKLFISYVQEIFSPDASVNLEYTISKKFKIKAKSGTEQSMDILYKIER